MTMNLRTGASAVVGPVDFAFVDGLAYQSDGLHGLTRDGQLLRIDTATGAGTSVGLVPPDAEGREFIGAASFP